MADPDARETVGDGGQQVVTTADGRRIAWSGFGDPAGAASGLAAIYCHGFPSSGREAALLDAAARVAGLWIVAPDRPGYGGSDPAPGRTLTGWADDCLALADGVGLDRFGLIGVSGGGPYALGCAWRLPRLAPGRLAAVTLVAPLGPIWQPALLALMQPAARTALALARAAPELSHALYGGPVAATMAQWPGLVEWVRAVTAPAVDRAALAEGENTAILNATIADAMAHGARGAREDLVLYTHDWQLPFAEIALPVRLWHGDADCTVPIGHGRWYAANLPTVTVIERPGEGHYSLPIQHADEILAALRADLS